MKDKEINLEGIIFSLLNNYNPDGKNNTYLLSKFHSAILAKSIAQISKDYLEKECSCNQRQLNNMMGYSNQHPQGRCGEEI